jgi:hypothetical protein
MTNNSTDLASLEGLASRVVMVRACTRSGCSRAVFVVADGVARLWHGATRRPRGAALARSRRLLAGREES